jgi:hypothetical protein
MVYGMLTLPLLVARLLLINHVQTTAPAHDLVVRTSFLDR